jgi:hypothetical protein
LVYPSKKWEKNFMNILFPKYEIKPKKSGDLLKEVLEWESGQIDYPW